MMRRIIQVKYSLLRGEKVLGVGHKSYVLGVEVGSWEVVGGGLGKVVCYNQLVLFLCSLLCFQEFCLLVDTNLIASNQHW